MSFEVQNAALRYLASRSRTVYEMKQYLKGKGFPEEEIVTLVEEFCDCGYLDDEAYCDAYFRYAFAKGKGRRKVFYELREKGIDATLAEIAFEAYLEEEGTDFDERGRALKEAEKILKAEESSEDGGITDRTLGKIARKLQSKGYGSDVIYSIIGELRG